VYTVFNYDPDLPYAVTLKMVTDKQTDPVLWTFSRDLLADAIKNPAGKIFGIGDVKVFRSSNFVSLTLGTNASNEITVNYPTVMVHRFLAKIETFDIAKIEIPDTVAEMFPNMDPT
jgi:hypothetical protein